MCSRKMASLRQSISSGCSDATRHLRPDDGRAGRKVGHPLKEATVRFLWIVQPRPAPLQDSFPSVVSPWAAAQPAPECALALTTTPPSGVSVRIESRRTRFNCGAVRFRQHTESKSLFESVSISMKGGWKETRGVQRPISAETPVSESRMAPLNPFETKRKKVASGTSSRVFYVQVAEGVTLVPNPLLEAVRKAAQRRGFASISAESWRE